MFCMLFARVIFISYESCSENHWQLYSFPDGLGDDLIIEVQDSNAKHIGRALLQIAAITDNPVIFFNPEIALSLTMLSLAVEDLY